MSVIAIQFSDHGIRFVADSRWTKDFTESEDRATQKIFRLGAVVFSAAGKIDGLTCPPLPVLIAEQGETILYRLSRQMTAKMDLVEAAEFQRRMGSIHTCWLAGKDPTGKYWLRGLSVTFENGQFKNTLYRQPCGPVSLLCCSGGRAVKLADYSDPIEFVKAVIALGGDCGGEIQEVCL